MKIAFIGNLPAASVFPHDTIRAKNRLGNHPAPWIQGLLPALARQSGYQMRVILVQHAILHHTIVEHDGVEYEGIPSPLPERWCRKSVFWSKTLQIRSAIRRFNPTLVHAFGLETGAATMALRSGYPVSCFIQGIVDLCHPFIDTLSTTERTIGLACESNAASRLRWLVAETEFARKWALGKNPKAHVALIPHPLRQDFIARALPTYQSSILTVGSLNSLKGMDTIIRAFAKVKKKSARLVMAGSGPLRHSLEALAQELGVSDRVEFAGMLDTVSVIERMNEASTFVIASRMDTSPNVVSEAHGIGLPVIGTRAGGIPEMIDDGIDGYHVDVDDVLAMSARMEELLSDPGKARSMGQAGRHKVMELNSPEVIADAHLKFFQMIDGELREDRAHE